MPAQALGRRAANELHQLAASRTDLHPGLLLAHGLANWPDETNKDLKQRLIDRICQQQPARAYAPALARWKRLTASRDRFAALSARIDGRLYIGVSRDNPLEAGVTVSHTYGVPLLPGSALKGLTRAAAQQLSIDTHALRWMFGSGGQTDTDDEIGGLVFHDAWWQADPDPVPFVAEIVTPHHRDYYTPGKHAAPSDTDSPIPAPQIAVQGSFYIAIEGPREWAQLARDILRQALRDWGIGAKRSSGYGRMDC